MSEVVVEAAFQDDRYYQTHGWPKAAASWLAAAIVGPLGRWMNRGEARELVDPQTGEVVRLQRQGGHTLFFIPMEWWGVIFGVLGFVLLFVAEPA